MATITSIELQKNKNRANIYIDGEFACGMDIATICLNKLKVNSIISAEELSELQQKSDLNKAFEKSISLLERQFYTEKQIKTKLMAKGYEEKTINDCIGKLKSYGYINDNSYAKNYVSSNKFRSRRELSFKLQAKGITSSIIADTVNTITDEDELLSANTLASKYMKNKENNAINAQKLFGYLVSKGYNYEIIKKVVNKYKSEDIDYD